MRAILFYVAAAVLAAGMILLSLGPQPWAPDPGPQAGAAVDGWRAFGPQALALAEVGAEARAYVARDSGGAPQGLRIVNLAGAGEASAESAGVRLLLAPEAIAELGPGPWTISVDVRPLGVTNAETLQLGLSDGFATAWSAAQPIPTEAQTLTFAVPALEAGVPAALSFWTWASRTDYEFGVEIAAVRIRSGG